jgi:hypothetical protein
MILDSLSYVDAAEGDLDTAGAQRAEAVDIALGPLDPALLCQVLVGVADQAMRCGRPYEAARLLGAAEAVGGGVDHSRPDGAQIAAAIQAALGESAYVEALGQARAEFSGARRGELTTLEAVRELTTSVLSAQAPKAG